MPFRPNRGRSKKCIIAPNALISLRGKKKGTYPSFTLSAKRGGEPKSIMWKGQISLKKAREIKEQGRREWRTRPFLKFTKRKRGRGKKQDHRGSGE